MSTVRLIIDPPAPGSWNMAVDHALLESADQSGQLTLRFYSWSEPTLSLGYFQPHADREQHPASLTCPLVRRTTGGGAIVHDQEITYSLCVPSLNRWAVANQELYVMMHQAIVDLLAASGIVAERYSGKQETGLKNPFLCFMRRSTGDVTIKEKKIAGSAQRRRKNALLQHGSLLLRRSEFAPELPGIEDLSHDLPADPNSIIDMWMSRLEPGLGAQLSQGMLTEQEFHLAQEIEQTNYRARTWSNRR